MEKIDLGENSNKEDKTKQKIGFGITFDKATGQAIAETKKKFAKPDYNTMMILAHIKELWIKHLLMEILCAIHIQEQN